MGDYGAWKAHQVAEADARIETDRKRLRKMTELCEWLVSMDDPEDVFGVEARRTVNLTAIISRAREALGAP